MKPGKHGKPSLSDDEAAHVVDVLRRLLESRYDGNVTKLSEALGRSQPAISQLLSGKNKPSLETAKAVAKLARESVSEMLGWGLVRGDTLPERAAAASLARIDGVPEWAIERVQEEPGLRGQRTGEQWYQRMRWEAAGEFRGPPAIDMLSTPKPVPALPPAVTRRTKKK